MIIVGLFSSNALVLVADICKHPTALKNADALLQDVLKAVDTNKDGRIQYNGMIDR